MVSQFAIDEIERLTDEGLVPTPRDIIRLNAFALAIEAARGKFPTSSLFLLPRTSTCHLGDDAKTTVTFRQPTIGHDIWLDQVMRCVGRDFQTALAVNAYALSRTAADLPDPLDRNAVKDAVDAFCASVAAFTTDQLFAAVEYVKGGYNHADGEAPAARRESLTDEERADRADDAAVCDWDECISVGLLYHAASVGLGLSLAEFKTMTAAQLTETTEIARRYHGIDADRTADATAQFYGVLNEIKERLIKEKEQPK